MTTPPTDPYPEHTKQKAVLERSQVLGEFLDEGTYILAEYREVDGFAEPQLVPVGRGTQQVLADWFGIDLSQIEAEKQAMLASMRGR
jgi:hypothetical protein